jgi:predicted RNA-binding Zn-ribbon protein involved in translation (DUF1610 family)
MSESEKKSYRLSCPICQTRLKIAEGITLFTCLNCGNELEVKFQDGMAVLEPSESTIKQLSETELELAQVNRTLKEKDDSYGVGCMVATLGLSLFGCVGVLVANLLQNSLLFWVTLLGSLVLLGLVLLVFINSSNRTTAPLIRKRDRLQQQLEREQQPTPPGEDNPEANPA